MGREDRKGEIEEGVKGSRSLRKARVSRGVIVWKERVVWGIGSEGVDGK